MSAASDVGFPFGSLLKDSAAFVNDAVKSGPLRGVLESLGLTDLVLGGLPYEFLFVLETAHIWFPVLTLFALFFFGPAAAYKVLGFRPNGGRANRAWLALSTAVTLRHFMLVVFNLPPIRAVLRAVGLEIVPFRLRRVMPGGSRGGARDARRANISGDTETGAKEDTCFADKFQDVAAAPTAFSSRVENEVTVRDYDDFKDRVGDMPNRLPILESNGRWSEMMDKSLPGLSYRAWRHVLPYGGTEYLSRTVWENSTVEEMCDFFNCDDTRASWDKLLFRHRVLERDERTGAECVFWERALPVISNRDYVFTRRTWKDVEGHTYWAINKHCTHSQTPETPNLKRVDPYFSAWRMRAIPGPDGRLTASECILSHFEEQKVNQDVARFAVKCGMWGMVKGMDVGFRQFQRDRTARADAIVAAGRGGAIGGVLDRERPRESFSFARDHRHHRERRGGGWKEALKNLAVGGVVTTIGVLAYVDAKDDDARRRRRRAAIRRNAEENKTLPSRRRRHGHHAVDAADADAIVDPRYVSASFVRGGGGGGEGEGDGAAREGGTASEQPGADSPAAGRGS